MRTYRRQPIILVVILLLSGIVLGACQAGEPEIDIDAQKTNFAHTAEAQSSMTAAALEAAQPTATHSPETVPATPTLTPTLEGNQAEETPGDPETTPTSDNQPSPTNTPLNTTDAAVWRANDPPDNTDFEPGEEFTVTWTLENIGTSTWTTSYYIQFFSGEQMEAEEKVYVPYPVPPGKNVQISVDFVAPESEGTKQSNWIFKNPDGETFYSFYIIIDVVKDSNPPAQPSKTPEPTATPDGS
jgi:hypothetical protein